LPLGASLNLNGLCIYITVATIFATNVFGLHLQMGQYLTIILTTVLAAMGAAAVPGSALIVMGALMSSVGIPLAAMPLIAGVDRFNDMAQTATNVTGDLFAATIVAKGKSTVIEDSEMD
jgi:Na+/H+-dicarboxylate symporter